ncbi:MAG: phosphodiesterase [Eubacteriales bacterium]|nr:phosphodiesterase [Eubacteriales bacterium]
MKLFFASDLHGSAKYCELMLDAWQREGGGRMFLLGDLLYHGPRNDLPEGYAPKQVITMLNEHKNAICTVRGNCDCEVDQMVLEFPILADYALLDLGKARMYATHGHVFNENHLPPLLAGDILIHGHTHLYEAKKVSDITILNPGSVSLPKGGNPHTYAILDEDVFQIKTFSGEIKKEIRLF